MIRYSEEEGFIKSEDIRDENDQRIKKVTLPSIAIGIFSVKLFENIVSSFETKKVGYFGGACYHRPVLLIEF